MKHSQANFSQTHSTLTQVRSKTKESKLTLHAVVVFWLKQTKQRNTKSALPQYHHKRELHLENLNFTVFGQSILTVGVVTSLNVSKCPCVCPITETLTHGMKLCMHCQLRGLMLLTSAQTISRRPLPISSLPFAPSWGCPICGGRSHPNGTYSAITSGIVAPIT